MNRKAVLLEERDQQASGGTQALRVMASLRRNDEDENACLQILVGRSGSKVSTRKCEGEDPAEAVMEDYPTCGDADIPCLAYANSKWVQDTNGLVEHLHPWMGHTGPLSEEDITYTFSISWQAKKPLVKGKYKLTPNFSEGVHFGTLAVRYPYVLFRGRLTCDQSRAVLDTINLSAVI